MIDGISNLITNLSDKFFADANDKLAFERAALQQAGQMGLAQLGVAKEEAKHKSVFVAGARPFLLWVCGVAFAMNFVVLPFLTAIAPIFGWTVVAVTLDWGQMMPVLLGMLGLGGYRTYEKMNGVETNSIKNRIVDKLLGGGKQ